MSPHNAESNAGKLRSVLMASFKRWDTNADGFLSECELGAILDTSVSLGNFDVTKHSHINYNELIDFLFSSGASTSNELLQKMPLDCLSCGDGHPMSEFAPPLQGWCCHECSTDLAPGKMALQCTECSGITWCAQCSLRLFTCAAALYDNKLTGIDEAEELVAQDSVLHTDKVLPLAQHIEHNLKHPSRGHDSFHLDTKQGATDASDSFCQYGFYTPRSLSFLAPTILIDYDTSMAQQDQRTQNQQKMKRLGGEAENEAVYQNIDTIMMVERLEEIWRDLLVEPTEPCDISIKAGNFSSTVAGHGIILERLTFWENELSGRWHNLYELHQQIKKLSAALSEDVAELLIFHGTLHGTPACEDELQRLLLLMERRLYDLQERRCRAIQVLGCRTPVCRGDDLAAYLSKLELHICDLEAEADACRQAVLDTACSAASIWQELDESPDAEDCAAVAISIGSGVITKELEFQVSETKARWDRHRMKVASEVAELHTALYSFGQIDEVAAFLALHGSLSKSDRSCCRRQLEVLRAKQRLLEEPPLERIRCLYETTGLGNACLEELHASLESAGTLEHRQSLLSAEETRMEKYLESVHELLNQLEEIKDLLTKAKHFEANTRNGSRFSGNCLHFLEQEKFRKKFARRYPALRDGLLFDLSLWEVEARSSFVFRGLHLRERLTAMREAEVVELVPGDVGGADKLLELLGAE